VLEILSTPRYKQRALALQQDFANYDAPTMAIDLVEQLIASQSLANMLAKG
jgi:UDP:flavonoid glycosyltransferase YjiC (YdhE family)